MLGEIPDGGRRREEQLFKLVSLRVRRLNECPPVDPTGICMPLFMLLFGAILDDIGKGSGSFVENINKLAGYMALLGASTSPDSLVILIQDLKHHPTVAPGVGSFCLSTLQVAFFSFSSARATEKLRFTLLHSILRQEVGTAPQLLLSPTHHPVHPAPDPDVPSLESHRSVGSTPTTAGSSPACSPSRSLPSLFAPSTFTLGRPWLRLRLLPFLSLPRATIAFQEGTGRRIADGAQAFAQFGAGLIIAFVKSWQLSLVLLAGIPVIGASTAGLTKVGRDPHCQSKHWA